MRQGSQGDEAFCALVVHLRVQASYPSGWQGPSGPAGRLLQCYSPMDSSLFQVTTFFLLKFLGLCSFQVAFLTLSALIQQVSKLLLVFT